MNESSNLFHIAEPSDWDQRTDSYAPAAFETEGFIHCSTADQLEAVAASFYAGRDDVILLTVDPKALVSGVVYEDLYEIGEEFPHIYGPIPLSAIVESRPYRVS
ncbi:MAG: DUF952 domain-containing protein [Acidimicrobiia bacterium]